MTIPDEPPQPRDEITDKQLDAMLAAADAQLVEYVRRNSNPTPVLSALLDLTGEETTQQNPGRPLPHPDTGPADLIAWRIDAYAILVTVRRARRSCDILRGSTDGSIATQRLVDVFHFLVRELGRVRDSARDLARAHAHALDLVDAIDRAIRHAQDLDRAYHRVHDLGRALDPDLTYALNAVLNRAVSRALTGDGLYLTSTIERVFSRALTVDDLYRTHDPIEDLSSSYASAVQSAVQSGQALLDVTDFADVLVNAISSQEVNASGADLSALSVPDLEILTGVVWSQETLWRPDLRERIAVCSVEISPGVYRVTSGGTERDPHEIVSS